MTGSDSAALSSLLGDFARITALLGEDDAAGGAAQPVPERPDANSPTDILASAFNLSAFERDVILLCAGVELDASCAAAVARVQAGGPPSFALALARLPNAHWSALLPTGPLRYWGLIEVEPGRSLVTSALNIDERILHFLVGLQYLDERLRGVIDIVSPPAELPAARQDVATRVAAALASREDGAPIVQIIGQDPATSAGVAARAAAECGSALLRLHARDLPQAPDELDRFQRRLERECLLTQAVLVLTVEEPPGADRAFDRRVAGFIDRTVSPLILAAGQRRAPGVRPTLVFDMPEHEEQASLRASGDSPNAGRTDRRLYGKYRGKVMDNVDPLFLGRLQVSVPAIPGAYFSWAMPCVPYAGPGVGFHAIPPIDANIWVEFEDGDTEYPIWTGCFWGPTDMLLAPGPLPPEVKAFKTECVTLLLSDLPELGGFTLACDPPAVEIPLRMTCDSAGITIECADATIGVTADAVTLSAFATRLRITDAGVLTDGSDPP